MGRPDNDSRSQAELGRERTRGEEGPQGPEVFGLQHIVAGPVATYRPARDQVSALSLAELYFGVAASPTHVDRAVEHGGFAAPTSSLALVFFYPTHPTTRPPL